MFKKTFFNLLQQFFAMAYRLGRQAFAINVALVTGYALLLHGAKQKGLLVLNGIGRHAVTAAIPAPIKL